MVHRNMNWTDLNRSLRTVSDAHHETDIVLRFFAGFMISTLHLSGTNEDVLWSSCGQHCRDEFVKCLQEFPGDWIRSFHLFVSDEEHLQPRNTRANSRKNGRSGSTNAHSCYLAQSITIGAHSFTHYAILVSTTPDSLIFILPAREADGRHFQYIEIPDQYILQCTQCTTKDLGEQKYALHLILNTAGSLMINGEEKPFNGSTVCINSDNDLRALYNALKESERKPKKGRVIRRISSTIVALDNGEEVARKSIQHFESSSEQQGCLSVNAGDAMDDNQESGIPGQPANEENTQSESARVTPAVDESQPTASREMFTSSAALGGTCLPVSPGKSAISEPRDADAQPPEKAHPIDCDTNLAETYLDKGDALLSKDLTSNAESEANADNSTGPQISNAESITLQPRHSSRSSTREQETQNKSPVSRNKRGRASSNRKDRSKLPNTQESLLFPLRRSTRKVYTSNSKAAVDWEEDLRPTEEDETEREVPKDLDVTSISSPSPGGKSIFNRKSNTAQKKRKARATPSSTKGKNQAKINRKSGNRGNKRTPKLPLQPKELNGRNDKAEEINSPRIDDTTDNVSGSSKSENRANGRPDILREKKGSSELAHHSAGTNDKTFSVSDQDLLSDKENRDPSVRSPREQGEPGNVVISGIDPDMKTASDLREQGLGEREQASPDREGIKSRDRYSLPQDHNIPPICGDDEQTPLARCISTQGALVPDKRPNYETTLNRREDSQNPKAVSKTDELFPASVEKYQTLNTSTHAATNEETMDASQQSMSEQYHPASDNKKRSAPQDRTSESQSKKARMSVFPVPYQQAMPQSGDLVTKNSGDDDISKEKPQTDNLSTRNSPGEECFTIPSPKSRDFRARRIPSPFNVSSQTKSSPLSTSSLKKSIVDENGSPRLVSRHYDSLDITRREIQFPRLEYLDEDTSSHSEYYGDHDDADFTDYSMSDKSSISTLRGPQAVASTTNESKTHPVSVLPGDTDEVEEGDHLNIGSRIPVTERPKGCTKEPNQLVKMMITPYSILGSPRKEASPEVQDPVLQGAASNDFAQPQPEVTERGKSIGRGHNQPDWQRSMETMQKATQDMLLSTNQVSSMVCAIILLNPAF